MRTFFRNLFFALGIFIILITIQILYRRHDPSRLYVASSAQSEITEIDYSSEKTASILKIEELGISLPIIPANRKGEKWETTSDGVSYLSSSPLPGEPGNTIMYGHNWGSILGRLQDIEDGQIIKIIFTNGEEIHYKVSSTKHVLPSDSALLTETDDIRLTLYTCSGFLDRKRFVVTAFLI